MKKQLLSALLGTSLFAGAQQSTPTITINKLQEVKVTSSRIDLPLSENSRTIKVITADAIRRSGVSTVVDLLQQVAGIDIRRRGLSGMQADLHIRGGSFDQTLLLIDGIKLEDAQTGHHSMNFALPLELIERIEIVKGPAARVFGQNAFTGAINIVTKSKLNSLALLTSNAGSYDQWSDGITIGGANKKSSLLAHYSVNSSDGYRYNTDFKHQTAFVKAQLNKTTTPIDFIASFSERKFGANGFYALPSYKDQYEETQASIVAFSSTISKKNWVFKPKLYWRRGQDEYLFNREKPQVYRNLHITNKVGASLDASYYSSSSFGTTGLGLDIARVSIASNNLGYRERWVTTFFAEQRFHLAKRSIDLTPGIALSNYSDFGTQIFPGIDVGYAFDANSRIYGNLGYTYRIPTFTDLFYSDSTTRGNENLEAEEALTTEIGYRFSRGNSVFSIAGYKRSSRNLIDYIRPTEEGQFVATNIRRVNSFGIDLESKTKFKFGDHPQHLTIGYSYLEDDVKQIDVLFSRYSINSLRHHFTFNYSASVAKNVTTTLVYKAAQRPQRDTYHVVDLSAQWQYKSCRFHFSANNIFNEEYSESNQVPMPLANVLLGLQFAL